MKTIYKAKIMVLALFIFSVSAFGQSNQEIEQNLVGHLKNIEKWSNYGETRDLDKLNEENKIFGEKLLEYTKNKSTLSYKFGELQKYMSVAASDDGKFRVYSWDRKTGGTMHFYASLYQYLGADGNVYVKANFPSEEGDPQSLVYSVYSVKTKKETIYLTLSQAIFSTSDAKETVNAFKISGNSLTDDVEIFKTDTGLKNSIAVSYNSFTVKNSDARYGIITFDDKTKTIRFPVVVNDNEFPNGKVTDKFTGYRFDGNYFVDAKSKI